MIPSEVDMCGADIELARSENHLHRVAMGVETGAGRGTI